MTAWIKPKAVTVPGVRLVEIVGVIDEGFDPAKTVAPLADERTPIVFDLGGVRRITSFGVRHWVAAMRCLVGLEYFFINCRPALVWQFNMIRRFGGNGGLISLFLPYSCSASCGEESEHLLDLRFDHELAVGERPPEHRCLRCGALAEFDEEPSAYFSYVRQLPPLKLPASVAALLDESSKTATTPLVISKEVTPELTAIWLTGAIENATRVKRIAAGLDGTVLVVAQGVRDVSTVGLKKLFDALTAESSHVYIARAPVTLARVIAKEPRASQPPIVSLWLGLQCDSCGHTEWRELDRARWPALRDGHGAACPRCRGTLAMFRDEAHDELSELRLTMMPDTVRDYLQARGTGPDLALTPLPQKPMPPRRLARDSVAELPLEGYEVLSRLGVGGMAEVLLARQQGPQGFNKLVALKRILPTLVGDPVFVDMFLREARIAAAISHANVVQIYDLRETQQDYFIVMEYVPGWNLDILLKTAIRALVQVPVELACRIVADICAGLHAAHSATQEDGKPLVVVHRDVSPHNVLVSRAGAVKLTDFGIAKATNVTAITKTDGLKGKFMYMAPERFDGVDSDVRSDVFSAGLILAYTLTQAHPFQGPTEYSTWENAVRAVVPPASALRDNIPPQLDAILARAVAREPDQRYQTAQELQVALERFITAAGKPATQADVGRWVDDLFLAHEATTEVDPTDITTRGHLKPTGG
jgi:eukaryotic-like serine/threonine-protein kinase